MNYARNHPAPALPRRRAFRLSSCLVALALAALAFSALAAERFLSVSELTAQAEVVVRAQIAAVSSRAVDTPAGRFSFIFYAAKTKAVLAGTCASEFSIRVPGLISSGRTITVADAPALGPGLEAVFFLRTARGVTPGSQVYDLVSLAQGVLPVAPETPGQEARVILPVDKPPGGVGPRFVQVKISDFARQLKAIQENRARGSRP